MHKLILSIIILLPLSLFAQDTPLTTTSFFVSGNCGMCKQRIEKAAKDAKAKTAVWDMKTGMLTVSFDPVKTTQEQIQKKIAESGHDNGDYKADDEVYKNLPDCCWYDRDSPGTAGEKNQHTVTGVVLEETVKGKFNPIPFATISNLHSEETAITDSSGVFTIHTEIPAQLLISYVGFEPDTIRLNSSGNLTIILKSAESGKLKEVVILARNEKTRVSAFSTVNTLRLGAEELSKAACCNLSESFETSPSVDVSYSDAVTGFKQIQLLGLSGNYTQLLTENIPEIKGLPGSYGLTFIPGPWIESIHLTKGIGSVVNGYESIAGQINVEEKKPDDSERLYINMYANNMGRLEANINTAHKLNDQWSTALLTHMNGVTMKNDFNKDGFLDMPLGRQFNLINRWKYANHNGWVGQFAIKYLNDDRTGGQLDYDKKIDRLSTHRYGLGLRAEQYTVSGKLGYVFPRYKYKSLGLVVSASQYNNNAYYGLTQYSGKQKNLYANFIYQSIIGNTNHKYRTGLSFSNENYKEVFNLQHFSRNEIVPGAFFEYTYTYPEKFTAIAGVRVDKHNLYGMVTTPRIHLKYDFAPQTNLRFSAGSGFRVANILAENAGVFVSNRQLEILHPTNQHGFGLNPEKAWNYGLNFIHNFRLNDRKGSLALDLYRTTFTSQTVADLDASPRTILFYNLSGRSYSNSFQTEINYEPFKKFDVRLAYRWLDVKTTYQGSLLEKPFTARHRAFINLAYETADKWKFDYTVQWISRKRIPSTAANPVAYRMPDYSPSFIQMAAQVTKVFSPKFELYAGGENLTGFIQRYAIIDAQNPFSQYFDGSMTWGPVLGRMIYIGTRIKI
ncbi:MAG: TonB-dependent receptor [Chitinophagaceae bacterium]|nr:TonB-dependent receptor [Chitinophagaceae bacterium]MCW5926381.1 TonB-dependent receptor [Chitinophagaceae bacterium]